MAGSVSNSTRFDTLSRRTGVGRGTLERHAIRSGMLLKRSNKGIFWNERFAVITDNKELQLKRRNEDVSCKQSIPLQYASLATKPKKGKKFPFQIITALGSMYEFACVSAEERNDWMESILRAVDSAENVSPDRLLRSSNAIAETTATVPKPITSNDVDAEISYSPGESEHDNKEKSSESDRELDPLKLEENVAEETVPAPVPVNRVSHSNSRLDWNSQFQEILEMPAVTLEDCVAKASKMNRLLRDFVNVSRNIAKTIINEYAVPLDKKSIKYIETDGISDSSQSEDQTFVERGILFRYITDAEYEDEGKMKAFTNESRASCVFLQVPQSDIRIGLSCLIDFMGFRIFAIALLPMGMASLSLKYGLNSKREWASIDPRVRGFMDQIGEFLHLKKHIVQGEMVRMNSDIKVHLGQDKRFYVTNLSRMLPADLGLKLKRDGAQTIENDPWWATTQFRYEFLKTYSTQLSPDAFAADVYREKEGDTDDIEAAKASRYLLDMIVSEFISEIEKLVIFPLDGEELCSLMHEKGINIRYLGQIAHQAKLPFLKDIVLVEMVARVCKVLLFKNLRQVTRAAVLQHSEADLSSLLSEGIVDFFNLILFKSEDHDLVWSNLIKPKIFEKYLFELDDSDIQTIPLLLALQRVCHVQFSEESVLSNAPLCIEDLISVYPRTKFLDFDNLEHHRFIRAAPKLIKQGRIDLASQAAHIELEVVLGDKEFLISRRSFKYLRALHTLIDIAIMEGDLNSAKEFIRQAVESTTDHLHPHICLIYQKLAEVQFLEGNLEMAQVSHAQSLQLAELLLIQSHPAVLSFHDKMGCHLLESEDFDNSELHFMKYLGAAMESVGTGHAETAKALNRLASLSHLKGDLDRAKSYYERALSIFELVYGTDSVRVATCCFYLSDIAENKGDIHKAHEFAQRSFVIRKSFLGMDDPATLDSLHQLAWQYYNGDRPETSIPYFDELFKRLKAGDASEERLQEMKNIITAIARCKLASLHVEEKAQLNKMVSEKGPSLLKNQ